MRSPLAFLTAGVRVDLLAAEDDVADLIRRVAADLVEGAPGPAKLAIDSRQVAIPDDADTAKSVAWLLHAVHRSALSVTHTMPIHAASLAGPSGCVVLPGASGAGKSTLAAAGMQLGLSLLSDEAACFTQPTGTVLPYARPLKLSMHSRRLLDVSDSSDQVEEEVGMAPEIFGRAAAPDSTHRCVGILIPRREPDQSTRIEPLSRAAALDTMLRCRLQSESTTWSHEQAWAYVTELVRDVAVATLRYDSPHEGAEALATWMGQTDS